MGKLLMSMYGTRRATQNCAEQYSGTLMKAGYDRGKANLCLFRSKVEHCSVMMQGDDLVAVGGEK